MSNFTVLAVHSGHNATAAIMRNGKILVAAMEERFAKKKNYVGYPKQAIDFCLRKSGITPAELDRVAYTTQHYSGLFIKAQTSTQFSIADYYDYFGERYYGRKLRGEDVSDYLDWLNESSKFNEGPPYYDFSFLTKEVIRDPALDTGLFRQEQIRLLSSHLGVKAERIEFLDHHTGHAYYAYYGSPFRAKDCLVITMDGWGDGRNQTVWLAKNDELKLLAESDQNDLGRIYKLATLLLGMRPDEHEFKVMGLAPYAKQVYASKTMQAIENICEVDGLRIVSKSRPQDLFAYLQQAWRGHRFDNIACAVQNYTEQIACQLVRNAVAVTGVRRVVLSGGIAMNVKMNKAILELAEVEELFICGSGGDESLSIGGCYQLNQANADNQPLEHLYLGSDIGDEFDSYDFDSLADRFTVNKNITHEHVAKLLLAGDVVAVVRGRAEFGARALGNRSILADPSRRDSVQRINEAIKNRDFWMPFALSLLAEHADDYVDNPKRVSSPFMATSLDTKPELYQRIQAGTHPYDRTVRPQFVDPHHAPQYHSLISAFAAVSGTPALLNTSLNLHGEPVVDSIADAVRTFELSGLDHLLINDKILLSKNAEVSSSSLQ